ncbi:MAG: exo-alpha-sialidase [Bryobacterales bacterium]|nr:exo-alpha-sialidase [Bryobacterales bacterium]
MLRRTLLATLPSAFATHAAPGIRSEVFLKSPGKGTAIMAYAFYTRPTGGQMTSVETRWSRSDTIDIAYIRRSEDNGRTWTEPVALTTGEKRPNGMLRRHTRAGFADPKTGRYLEFWLEGVLPSDDPLEGMRIWNLYYRVSSDGKTFGKPQLVIHEGREFNASHPLPGVYTGRNCVMLGDQTSKPVAAPDGSILLPVQLSVLGPDGKLANPGGGYTYTNAAMLRGRWKGDQLVWRMSDELKIDPAHSTRGAVEPTIEILDDGRILMVLRASNDKRPEIPSHRWIAYSRDGARWTEPQPWTYDSGEKFFSPSSCSQLLKHSSGKLFWLGNINPTNPRGNRPRYPLVMGEVDRRSGLLLKNTLRTIDDRKPGEHELLTLSNFYAREDRETKEIALHMTRLFAFNDGWEGDALLYRIPV